LPLTSDGQQVIIIKFAHLRLVLGPHVAVTAGTRKYSEVSAIVQYGGVGAAEASEESRVDACASGFTQTAR
jgi:hypothetical protein